MIVGGEKQSLVHLAGTRKVHSATPIATLDGLAIGKPWSNARRIARQGQQTLALIAEQMVILKQSFVEERVGPTTGVAEAGAVQKSTIGDVAMVPGDEAVTPRNMQTLGVFASQLGIISRGTGVVLVR